MDKRLACQITIQKRDPRPYPLKRVPKHQKLGTILSVQRHHLISLDAKILCQPIPDPLNIIIKLPVSPRPTFEFQKEVAPAFGQRVILQDMVNEEFSLLLLLSDELKGFCCCIVQTTRSEIVADVEAGVEVGGCCCDAGECCGGRRNWDGLVSRVAAGHSFSSGANRPLWMRVVLRIVRYHMPRLRRSI